MSGKIRITRGSGNVFRDLGFGKAEAENLKLRSELMMRIDAFHRESGMTQGECAKLLGLTQPRLNALLKGRLSLFSLDTLVNIASRAGLNVRLVIKKSGLTMAFKDISEVAAALRAFAAERDWDQFHTPKNLAAAMSVEAAEVLEHFQWDIGKSQDTDGGLGKEKTEQVAMELADVFLYLVRLSDRLGVDLLRSAERKMEINARNYPADFTRGAIRKDPMA